MEPLLTKAGYKLSSSLTLTSYEINVKYLNKH
jgi:hypothetical protein